MLLVRDKKFTRRLFDRPPKKIKLRSMTSKVAPDSANLASESEWLSARVWNPSTSQLRHHEKRPSISLIINCMVTFKDVRITSRYLSTVVHHRQNSYSIHKVMGLTPVRFFLFHLLLHQTRLWFEVNERGLFCWMQIWREEWHLAKYGKNNQSTLHHNYHFATKKCTFWWQIECQCRRMK